MGLSDGHVQPELAVNSLDGVVAERNLEVVDLGAGDLVGLALDQPIERKPPIRAGLHRGFLPVGPEDADDHPRRRRGCRRTHAGRGADTDDQRKLARTRARTRAEKTRAATSTPHAARENAPCCCQDAQDHRDQQGGVAELHCCVLILAALDRLLEVARGQTLARRSLYSFINSEYIRSRYLITIYKHYIRFGTANLFLRDCVQYSTAVQSSKLQLEKPID